MAILSILLTVIMIAVSILMVLIVLVQRPKQEGLGAAFGGGTLDSALGAHTTDVLQKMTTWFGVVFFVSAIGLAMLKTREFKDSAASNVLEEVENREPAIPGLPPSISDQLETLPAAEGVDAEPEAPAPQGEKAKAKEESAPEGKAKEKADVPNEKADTPKEKAAPKAKESVPAEKAKGAGDKAKGKAAEESPKSE